MDARFLGFDNILETLGINSSKSFQLVYNEALSKYESEGLNIAGCVWAPMQADFSYSWLEADGRISAMATYVDLNSEPVARGKNVELSKVEGTIPRQKRKIVKGENDYRKEITALNNADTAARLMGRSPSNSVREYLAKYFFDTLAEIPTSHAASLSYARGQMFGARALTLTDENNPSGLQMTFKSEVPAANVDNTKFYTVDSLGAVTYVTDVDPILNLRKKVRSLKNDPYHGYPLVTVEINAKSFFTLIEHPLILQRLGFAEDWKLEITAKGQSAANAAAAAQKVGYEKLLSNSDEFAKNWFKAAIGADELIVDTTIVGVDKLNAVTKRFDTNALSAFPEGVILVRPSGDVAQIFNVACLRPDASAVISAEIFGGRGIVEYFYDARTRTQTWISELTALPVPTRPKDLYYFEFVGVTPGVGG